MRSSIVLALALLVAVSFAVEQEDGVYVLDNENYDAFLAEQKFALVEFYAPWCGHCKRLTPEFAAAAKTLGEAESTAVLAKVDATVSPLLAQRYEVKGYPTLFWFDQEHDEPLPYQGPRDAAGISKWVSAQTTTALVVVASQAALEEMEGPVVVLFGESEAYSSLLSISKTVSDVHFVQVTDEAEFGEFVAGDIAIYRESKGVKPSSKATALEDIFAFILANAYPNVVPFTNENFGRLASKAFTVIAVDAISDETVKDSLLSVLDEVAATRSELFGFIYGDSVQLGRGVQGAGASGNVFPTAVAINAETNTQFAFDENFEFNSENLAKWVDGLLDGTTQPFKKSEDVPENNDGPVTTLVAKNFDIIQGKDALVKYYAPWCGHCKTLAPIYEEVAAAFADNDVIIAKIDATANYIEADVSGFPTLIWYSKNGDQEVYSGDRSPEGLTAFLNSKVSAQNAPRDEL